MIVTIDGPAGSGKSTVAKRLARKLEFQYLDTGAMYRAVALAGMRKGVDWDRPDELAAIARGLDIRVDGRKTLLDGEDVSDAIRTSETTAATRQAADNSQVREHLVQLQRAAGVRADIVTEGRDQGTLVFPNAQCKFFLTAGPEERARRRLADLLAQGEKATLAEVLESQERRDREDMGREFGRLVAAKDSVEVCTDGMTIEQVVDRLAELVRSK